MRQALLAVAVLALCCVLAPAASAQDDTVIIWSKTDTGDIWFADGRVVNVPCEEWHLVYYWQNVEYIFPDCYHVQLTMVIECEDGDLKWLRRDFIFCVEERQAMSSVLPKVEKLAGGACAARAVSSESPWQPMRAASPAG